MYSLALLAALSGPHAAERSFVRRPVGGRHLYVADRYAASFNGLVLRYELKGGILSSAPVSVLSSTVNPLAVAIGPDGNLYVGSANVGSSDVVKIYRPDAQGNANPLRTLVVPSQVTGLALDGAGDLYVQQYGYGGPDSVLVYPPNAQGSKKPLETIVLPTGRNFSGFEGLSLDAAGDLFARVGDWVYVYANPASAPSELCRFSNPNGTYSGGIDVEKSGRIVFTLQTGFVHYAYAKHACPAKHRREMLSQYPALVSAGGVAPDGRHLFTTDYSGSVGPAIFEFDRFAAGTQTPLAVATGSGLVNPVSVAVGP